MYLSVTEAAKLKNVTRQALYLAIHSKRLNAYKCNDEYKILMHDLDIFDKQRFSRQLTRDKGELIFDESKGYISINRACEILGVPLQKLYYAIRTKKLKAIRKRAAWVIHMQDLLQYHKEHLKCNLTMKQTS